MALIFPPSFPFPSPLRHRPKGQGLRSPCFRSSLPETRLPLQLLGVPASTSRSPSTRPPGGFLYPESRDLFSGTRTLKAKNACSGPFALASPCGSSLSTPICPCAEGAGFSRCLGFLPPLPLTLGVPASGITLSCWPRAQPHPILQMEVPGLIPRQASLSPTPALVLSPVQGQFYRKGHGCAGRACLDLPCIGPHLLSPQPVARPQASRWSCAP